MKHNAHYLAWILNRIETRRSPEGFILQKPFDFDEICEKIIAGFDENKGQSFMTGTVKIADHKIRTGIIKSKNWTGAYFDV